MKKGKKRNAKAKAETGLIVAEPHEIELTKGPKSIALDIQTLFMNAITGKLPPDQMEKLLAMRRELMAEHARKQYYIALSNFQEEMQFVGKNKKVNATNLKYSYASIDQIVGEAKPVMKKWGFSYSFDTEQNAKEYTAVCIIHHEAGHSETSKFTVPVDKSAYVSAPQAVAQSSTFAQRYAFRNAMGIITTDDDNDANGVDKRPKPPTPIWAQAKTESVKSKLDPKKEVKQPGEIPEGEKCKAYCDRIRALALAESNNDLNIMKDWLLRETEKYGTKGVRPHSKFSTMTNSEIIQFWELIKGRVIEFENATQAK